MDLQISTRFEQNHQGIVTSAGYEFVALDHELCTLTYLIALCTEMWACDAAATREADMMKRDHSGMKTFWAVMQELESGWEVGAS